jgi:hypothetical protein
MPVLLSTVSVFVSWSAWLNGHPTVAPFVLAYATYEASKRHDWPLMRILSATACMVTSRKCSHESNGLFYWLSLLLPSYFCLLQWTYMQQALVEAFMVTVARMPHVEQAMLAIQEAFRPTPVVATVLTENELEYRAPLRFGRHCVHPNLETCAVCFDDVLPSSLHRHLPCQHIFHAACVDPWLLQRSAACPMCRKFCTA